MSNKWPPTKQYVEKLEEKAEKYDELKDKEMVSGFVDDFGKLMLTNLAAQPFDNWPEFAKQIFRYAEGKYPALAALYLRRLPQESSK